MSRRISGGVLIGSAPFVGYLVAFLYEAGYARVFEVPFEVIGVSVTNVFISIFALIGVAAFLGLTAQVPRGFLTWGVRSESYLRDPVALRSLKLEPLVYPFLVLFAISLYDWHFTPWVAILVFLSWPVYLFLWPLMRQRSVAGYREKLRAQDAVEEKDEGSWNRWITSLIRRGLFAPLSAAIIVVVGAFYAGTFNAIREKDFLSSAKDPSLVIVRIYGDTVVARKISTKNPRRLTADLFVWKIGEQPLQARRKEFGRLRVENEQRSGGAL